MRTLLGCPSKLYLLESLSQAYENAGGPLQLYQDMKDYGEKGGLFSLSTAGFGDDDTKTNFCGVTIGHAFPIIGFIEVDGNPLYIIRDPRGKYAHTRYN